MNQLMPYHVIPTVMFPWSQSLRMITRIMMEYHPILYPSTYLIWHHQQHLLMKVDLLLVGAKVLVARLTCSYPPPVVITAMVVMPQCVDSVLVLLMINPSVFSVKPQRC